MSIDFSAYSPGRRAEIEACASEVRSLAARRHDLLPLCGHELDGCADCTAIIAVQRQLGIRQAQLQTLMTMAAMDALITSMAQSQPEPPRSSFWRRLFAPLVSSAAAGASSGPRQEPE